MKLAAIVTIYYPDVLVTVRNIQRYIEDVDMLILWDNTPVKDRDRYVLCLDEYSNKIVYLGTGYNEGIAYALNRSFEWAIRNGYEYVLTMDQDSYWNDFSAYKQRVVECHESDVAIFAPIIKSCDRILRCNSEKFVITSGSIDGLSIFKRLGLFREDFFIDEVDNEYCIRCKKEKYRIKVMDECYLLQVFGVPEKYSFWGRYTANYSPMRTFYQIRNRMWVWREYSNFLSYRYLLRTLLFQILRRSVIILVYEKDKKKKMKAITKAVFHGCCLQKGCVQYYTELNE